MKRPRLSIKAAMLSAGAMLTALAVLAPGSTMAGGEQPDQRSDAPTASTAAKKVTKLRLQQSAYGQVLFDGKGGALYLFTADSGKTSNCYGDCAVAWPPFYAKGKLRGGPGVNKELLGKTTRSDGRRQVTYAGKPLYYYVHDTPNKVFCHDVFEFGGDWLVVRSSGKPAP